MTILTLLLVAFPFFQDPGESDPGQGPPLLSMEEVSLGQYTPEHVDADELEELAGGFVGREFFVKERGGYASDPVPNIRLLGRSLVLFDTAEYQKRILETLRELDQPGNRRERPPAEPLVEFEYRPRFLSMDGVLQSLGNFLRQVTDGESYFDNIGFSRERGVLVVRESAARGEEIRALLARIDVPQPQVVISCQLVRGTAGRGEDVGLPAELSTNLRKLVPGYSFEAVGFALLQSSAAPGGEVMLKLETSVEADYQLSFLPVAFDEEQSSLSVAKCKLTRSTGELIFTTDTMFRGGEYTVLGASGTDPDFVVVRVTPLGGGK